MAIILFETPSFRFHLTMDTLGLGYILPTTRADSELSSVSDVRRQAHEKCARIFQFPGAKDSY